jgi:hypothetical protein
MIKAFRILALAGVIAAVLLVAFWRMTVDEQARTIAELRAMQAEMEARLAEREAMIDRLSRSRRIAHIEVIDQDDNAAVGDGRTTVRFIELDDQGAELARQIFTIPGHVLYVDAWTVKFRHADVASGHPLLGRSLVLLRKIYSERMPPREGLEIDTPGAVPPGYAASEAGRFEQRLWSQFWEIATDARLADQLGVRVAQGEVVYKPVAAGERYELTIDASGGMSLTPLEAADAETEPMSMTLADS